MPQLTADSIARYYSAEYYGEQNSRFNRLFERLILWFRNRRARKLIRMRTPGRVLDIGCGRGLVLAYLRDRGWNVTGVELNENAARHARNVLGVDVHVRAFDGQLFADQEFDVVILWHVLEHLSNISSTLAAVERILKPGGLIVIAVPNIESWQAQFARYHWFHLDLPRHYVHFSEAWLRSKMGQLGFRVCEVNHFSLEQNPYGWIQSILNRVGLRKNLLYDVLKCPSARTIQSPIRRYPVQSFSSLVAFALLLPIVGCLQILECVFRKGATIELYAVKSKNH